jgi:hypothetical protein
MSQILSPSLARCYGKARVARVWKISRASVYRSLEETPPNMIAGRPGPVGACSDGLVANLMRLRNSQTHGGHMKSRLLAFAAAGLACTFPGLAGAQVSVPLDQITAHVRAAGLQGSIGRRRPAGRRCRRRRGRHFVFAEAYLRG